MYILIIIIAVAFYFFLYRNTRVLMLRQKVNKMCYDYNMKKIEAGDFANSFAYTWAYNALPDYFDMMFSFKSLKLNKWLSEDIIKRLNE